MSLRNNAHRAARRLAWRLVLRGATPLLIGGVLAVGSLSDARAQAGDPRFVLNASGAGVTCDAPSDPTECEVGLGAAFTLSIDLLDPPAAGYIVMQTQLYLDGLSWTPASVEEEIVWPDSELPLRAEPAPGITNVAHGGLSALSDPFPVSHHEGSLVELRMSCSSEPETFDPTLVGYNPSVSPIGTSLNLPDNSVVPAANLGTAALDLNQDGFPLRVPYAYILKIKCGGQSAPPGDGVPGQDEGDFPAQAPATITPVAGSRPTGSQPTSDGDGTPGATSGNATPGTPGPGAEDGEGDDDGGAPWAIIGVVIGAVAVAGAGGAYLWYLRRSRASGGVPPAES